MQTPRERLADRLSGIGWIAFGTIIVAHAMTMEVRTHLGATFQTGPGLVPALIGGALVLLGLVLVLRSWRGEVVAYFDAEGAGGRRVLLALALMLIYGLGLIGRVPFGAATFVFVTSFVLLFNLPAGNGRALVTLAAKAAVTGFLVAVTVSFVFQTIFLVRLP